MEDGVSGSEQSGALSGHKAAWLGRHFGPAAADDLGRTHSGIPIRPLYTPDDVAGLEYARDLGFPGDPPFTRGVYPTMYRGRGWTMRPLAGYGTPEDTNTRLRYLLRSEEHTSELHSPLHLL